MNYEEAIKYIHSLLRFGSVPGLERIKQLLSALGNPQDDLKFIHVAGTNGKGSVSSMMADALQCAGYRTGLYISPYIICFRERIQVNGEYIDETSLARLTNKVRDTGITVTEFEFITAVAFLYYKEQNCDVVVLETGLGGRLDATNVIKDPLACVITGIGLDHTAVLGNTIEQIAKEKCGIIKDNAHVVTTYKQPVDAMRVIKSYNNVVVTDSLALSEIESGLSGNRFIYKGNSYETALIGKHQIENAMLAIEALLVCDLNVPLNAIKRGIANARVAGRLELISKVPIVLFDGAHNPHGAAMLAEELKNHKNVSMIMGMMADKECDEVLSLVAPYAQKIITVTVENNPRAINARDLAVMASKYCNNVVEADSYAEALEKTKGDETIFITGSLYLVSSIRDIAETFYNSQKTDN